MLKQHNRLLSNFFSLSAIQVVNYILPLILIPYLVRVLGVEKFGIVMYAQAIAVYFNVFVDYGFNLTATRDISINRDNKDKIVEIYSSVFCSKLILLLISAFILLLMVLFLDKFNAEKVLYISTFGMVIGQFLFPVWVFQGYQEMKYVTIIHLIVKFSSIVLIFFWVKTSSDYCYVPIFNSLGYILGGLFSLVLVKTKFGSIFDKRAVNVKPYFIDGFPVFISTISSSALYLSPPIILGFSGNYTNVGYYSSIEKIVVAFKNLFLVVNQTFFPFLSSLYKNSPNSYSSYWRKLFLVMTILGILTSVVLCLLSAPIINIIYGFSAEESVIMLNILSWGVLTYIVINLLGLQGLLVLGLNAQLAKSQILPALIFLALSPVCMEYFSVYFLIGSMIVSEVMIIVIRFWTLHKHNFFAKNFT